MAGRYFGIPFATTGNRTVTPDAVQPDGSVSYSEGFGFDYERPNTDPAYKPVPRDGMNGLFYDITEAIGIVQKQGFADWTSSAAPYAINSCVRHNSIDWQSQSANNSDEPGVGAGATSWRRIGGLATSAETVIGNSNILSTTPAGVAAALAAFLPKRSFSANDSIRIPDVPGGLIVQWGTATVANNGSINFTTPFPNNVFLINLEHGFNATDPVKTAVGAVTNSSFIAKHDQPIAIGINYIAIGY